jgi:hypothetical protein
MRYVKRIDWGVSEWTRRDAADGVHTSEPGHLSALFTPHHMRDCVAPCGDWSL